jgi:hypothetical protein
MTMWDSFDIATALGSVAGMSLADFEATTTGYLKLGHGSAADVAAFREDVATKAAASEEDAEAARLAASAAAQAASAANLVWKEAEEARTIAEEAAQTARAVAAVKQTSARLATTNAAQALAAARTSESPETMSAAVDTETAASTAMKAAENSAVAATAATASADAATTAAASAAASAKVADDDAKAAAEEASEAAATAAEATQRLRTATNTEPKVAARAGEAATNAAPTNAAPEVFTEEAPDVLTEKAQEEDDDEETASSTKGTPAPLEHGKRNMAASPQSSVLDSGTTSAMKRSTRKLAFENRDRWLAEVAPLLFRNAYIGSKSAPQVTLSAELQALLDERKFDFLGHLAFTTVFTNEKHDTVIGAPQRYWTLSLTACVRCSNHGEVR